MRFPRLFQAHAFIYSFKFASNLHPQPTVSPTYLSSLKMRNLTHNYTSLSKQLQPMTPSQRQIGSGLRSWHLFRSLSKSLISTDSINSDSMQRLAAPKESLIKSRSSWQPSPTLSWSRTPQFQVMPCLFGIRSRPPTSLLPLWSAEVRAVGGAEWRFYSTPRHSAPNGKRHERFEGFSAASDRKGAEDLGEERGSEVVTERQDRKVDKVQQETK